MERVRYVMTVQEIVLILTSKCPCVVVVVDFVVVLVVVLVVVTVVGGSVGTDVVGALPPEQIKSSLKMRLLMKGAEAVKWTMIPI